MSVKLTREDLEGIINYLDHVVYNHQENLPDAMLKLRTFAKQHLDNCPKPKCSECDDKGIISSYDLQDNSGNAIPQPCKCKQENKCPNCDDTGYITSYDFSDDGMEMVCPACELHK